MEREYRNRGGDDSMFDRIKKLFSSFFTRHKKKIYSAAVCALCLYLLKRKFYDRLIPASDAMRMIM
jgi:hypothetical protein